MPGGGRRPPHILARARALVTHRDDRALLPLSVLALLIGVHVKTLRAAARDGRLPVTYDTRTTFRRFRARATLAAATQFRHAYYGRQVRPADRRQPLTWASVPEDYDAQIQAVRRARGLSQAQLATLVGAAGKAVVYQWEARKRTPSPLFLATTRRAPLASDGTTVSDLAPWVRWRLPAGASGQDGQRRALEHGCADPRNLPRGVHRRRIAVLQSAQCAEYARRARRDSVPDTGAVQGVESKSGARGCAGHVHQLRCGRQQSATRAHWEPGQAASVKVADG